MSCIISEIKRDIGRESRFFIPCFRRPHLGVQSEYCHNVWQEKLEWCGCPTVKNVWWYVCQLFSTRYTNVTDRRTDRHRKNHTHRSVNTHTVLISLLITWPEVVAWRRSFWSNKDTSKRLGGLAATFWTLSGSTESRYAFTVMQWTGFNYYRASAYWRADARYWYSKSVRPSVCPSVTFRYHMKTA